MKNPNGPSIEEMDEWNDELSDQRERELRDETPAERERRIEEEKAEIKASIKKDDL